jgi:hypothetical protein
MMNLHTKVALFNTKLIALALASLAVSLSACKKEEVYGSLTLNVTSMDFEWGQTKEVHITSENIRSFGSVEAPQGWSCYFDGNILRITSPTEAAASTAELTGSVKFTAIATNDANLTRSVAVSVKIAKEIVATANSMIISTPGQRFKFNAHRRGEEQTNSITGAIYAERVWSTSRTAIVNVSYENGYIYFATADTQDNVLDEGNALIAVMDADGKTLWSWHLWITDYDPTKDYDLYGGEMVMDRNLGALANSNATPEDVVRSYGLYYQWGRKDPFVGPRQWNSTAPASLYTKSGIYTTHKYVVSSAQTGTIEYAIANPNTFIAGAGKDNGFDWLFASRDNSLWASAATAPKSIYDPCPAGWRVAPPSIWAGFTTTGGSTTDRTQFAVDGDYNYGWTFAPADGAGTGSPARVFYPAAGRRSFSPTLASAERNFTNIINDDAGVGSPVGFYWSSVAPASFALADSGVAAGSAASRLAFRGDYINPDSSVNTAADKGGAEGPRANGFPLRCVAMEWR